MNDRMATNILAKLDAFINGAENKALLLGEMDEDTVTEAHARKSNISMALADTFEEMLDLEPEQIDAIGVVAAMMYLSAMEDVHKCARLGEPEHDTTHDVEHFASVLQDYLLAAAQLTLIRQSAQEEPTE